MKTTFKRHASVALLLPILGYGLALASEPLTDPNSLTFENKDEALRWANGGRDNAGGGGKRPTYVAVVPVNKSQFIEGSLQPGSVTPFFGGYVRAYRVSSEQLEFLSAPSEVGPADSRGFLTIDEGPGARPRQAFLYAVSQDDARKMAQAYLAHANALYSKAVEEKARYIRTNSDSLENNKRRLAELDEILKKAPAEFEELKSKVTYQSEDQARQVIPDLDKAIHAYTIDIAGIRTKLEWITNYLHNDKGTSLPESARPRLDSMFVEESIALRAAEARLKTATDLRTQAQRYIELDAVLFQGPKDREAILRRIRQAEESIPQAKKEMADLIPPAVPGGKVIIHKVRPAQDQ